MDKRVHVTIPRNGKNSFNCGQREISEIGKLQTREKVEAWKIAVMGVRVLENCFIFVTLHSRIRCLNLKYSCSEPV